eukprot:5645757-Amphidinium_carterae.1
MDLIFTVTVPGIVLDCSKCYERIPLSKLEQFALESGYPLYALYACLDMYSGRRRVLIQGSFSSLVTATNSMPQEFYRALGDTLPFVC